MIAVAINGYGTIGKRVADAVSLQPDMKLIGVAKTSPNYEAFIASRKGYRIFAPQQNLKSFEEKGIKVAGSVEDMVREADVIVDATPNGVGAKYKQLYESSKKRALFQGGEKSSVAEVSFSALCNYDEAVDKNFVRVVSCNTTGLLRTLCTLNLISKITKVRATIVRRAADPKEVNKGPINSLNPDPVELPSHHAKDVNTVLRDIDIFTAAIVAPTTLMHLHTLEVNFSSNVEVKDVLAVLGETERIVIVPKDSEVESTAEVMEVARDLGRNRGDLYEVALFEGSVSTKGSAAFLTYGVHQESIVVPENVDAIRAVASVSDGKSSIRTTNQVLGIKRGRLI